MHIGTPPEYQRLVLKRNGSMMCDMPDESKMLGYYSVVSGDEIHIIDSDPYSLSRNGGLTDVSLVEKYKISDEAYDQRKGTVRDYIREQKKLNPNYKKPAPVVPKDPSEIPGPESVEGMKVGDRCEVMPGARRGTVRYVGEIEQISAGGHWVGVQFDEPVGHNDGTVKGVKIFDCLAGYGAFIRGKNVQVGDFPERDLFADDEACEDGGCGGAACKQTHEANEDEI